jgi:uncharacterized membrane protein
LGFRPSNGKLFFVHPRLLPIFATLALPTSALAADSFPDRLATLLGRLHQAIAHFPVGLLLIAGLLELVGAAFHTDRLKPAARTCLILGALAAIIAATFGWLNADFDHSGPDSTTLMLHRWGGIALAAAAVLAALLSLAARTPALHGLSRLFTILTAVMVIAVGHWGGTLVHGDGYLLAALAPATPEPMPLTPSASPLAAASPPVAHSASPSPPTSAESTSPASRALLPAAAEKVLNDSSDQGVFTLRRAIRLASLPAAPPVPATTTSANNEVDHFITAKWRDAKLPEATTPPALCDDQTFARRAYLDLIGVIPTIEELDRFLTDTTPDKRDRLIDELLARDSDYADHWTPFWEDALGSSYANLQGGVPTRGNYRQWINDSFKSNKPFDLFAAELIDTRMPGAKKPEIGDANGKKSKVAYIRNETHTDTLQSAAAVAQVFLGTSVKCASCHNHFENDEWPQKRALAYSSLFAAQDLELIRCEQKTGESIAAAFCFDIPGAPKDIPPDEPGRLHRAAQLITDPLNPRFAKSIVNRLWKRYLGLGLVEPTDDFRADTLPTHPELLDWLAHDLATHDFNLKRTIRLILTSRTYQFRYDPSLEDHFDVAKKTDPRYFRSPALRRLTAEQVVDSIRLAADQKPDPKSRLYHVNESTALSRSLGKPASRNEISTNRADDAAVVQSLELLNGEEFAALIYSAAILDDTLPDPNRSAQAAGQYSTENQLSLHIAALYKAVLSREPTSQELSSAREYVGSAATRTIPPADPVTTLIADDDTPEYAELDGEWNWQESPLPALGTRSRLQKADADKKAQHYVKGLKAPRVGSRDTLFINVFLDPKNPPQQIMVQWNDGSMHDGGWMHRAYWGEDKIKYGQADTPTRRRLGDLPQAGTWVRLEIPAKLVGFDTDGTRLVGIAFDQFGGTVHWDAAGVITRPPSPTSEGLGDLMWALLASPEFQYIR